MVSFVVFLTLAPFPFLIQIAARIVLIPVIAGISYEILKASAGRKWLAFASKPGNVDSGHHHKGTIRSAGRVAIASLLAALEPGDIEELKQRGSVNAAALAAEYNMGEDGG